MAEPVSPDTIFCAAIEIADEAQRAAYIAGACGGDQALRERVEKLVAAHFRAGGFLEEPPQPTGAFDPATPPPRDSAAAAGPSRTLGPYKLVQEIGEGGMGTVYLAQQTEPVKRLVALKVVRPGLDSRSVLARFEAERQALALMDHPNIARVLDAGSGPDGRPYFVMELVKGVPFTKYCDDHRLTPRQRLELYVPVCQAVQHAHQKGIIHRDIKPSNVLVCLYDGRPVPKVIDFGIAKATGQQLTEKTLVTGFGNVVGTLEYMSPEQAELNQLDVDTRSDVYSLGVLLYELLTGSTPLDRKRLKEAALLEVLRAIREEEPPRPSTRLSTTEELPSVAANRGLDPRKLSGLVRGELDWIVMKALEKDRNRRYETANGLAADVQRYLADEPVQACPPSAWYRFRKFARRNKTVLTTATVTALALLLGTAVSTWQAIRATNATNAEREVRVGLDEALIAEKAAREAAGTSARIADGHRREAEASQKAMQITLADMNVAQGLMADERGNPAQAVLWFANAVRLSRVDPQRESSNRVRVRNWSRMVHTPVAVLSTSGGVLALAFHPRSDCLLARSITGELLLWDVRKDEAMPLPGERRAVGAAVWSPDGGLLAVGDAAGQVEVLAFPSRRLLHRIALGGPIRALAFDAGGSRLAMAGQAVRVWDVRSQTFVKGEPAHPQAVETLLFNARGDRLVTGCRDNRARVFSVGGEEVAAEPLFAPVAHVWWPDEHDIRRGAACGPAYVDGGRALLTRENRASAAWWDAETGKLVRRLPAPPAPPIWHPTLAADPPGRYAALCGVSTQVWDTVTARSVASLPMRHCIASASFSGDGLVLLTGGLDNTYRMWSLPEGRLLAEHDLHDVVTTTALSTDGRLLAAGTGWGASLIRVYSAAEGNPSRPASPVWTAASSDTWIKLSRDGHHVISSGWFTAAKHLSGARTQVHEVETSNPVGVPLRAPGPILNADFSPDGRRVVLAAYRPESPAVDAGVVCEVSSRDWRTGKHDFDPVSLSITPVHLCCSPDGTSLAIISSEGKIFLLDAFTGKVRATFQSEELKMNPDRVSARQVGSHRVGFDPAGKHLLAWGIPDEVRVWDLATGRMRTLRPVRGYWAGDVQFSADGRHCSAGGAVWSFASGELLGRLPAHPDVVFAHRFSPDGRRVATACRDGMVRLWDWRSGRLVCPPFQHKAEAWDLAFTPDGLRIASTAWDQTVRLWDVQTGQQIAPSLRLPGLDGCQLETDTGGRSLVVTGHFTSIPAFDLQELCRPDELPADELCRWGELVSGQRIHEGGNVVNLARDEWLSRWRSFRKRQPARLDAVWSTESKRAWRRREAEGRRTLGRTLLGAGRLDDAVVVYRQAVALWPEDPDAHYNLGIALLFSKQLDEAIAASRAAIQLRKDYPEAHHVLGAALAQRGRLSEAIPALREATRLKEDDAEMRINLGIALSLQGELREALQVLRRARAIAGEDQRWRSVAAQRVREVERQIELDGRLPDFLAGKATPAGAAERVALAELCVFKHLDRAACRFYEEALAAEPKLAVAHRYKAARAAARAGCDRARDADKFDDVERARLRRQALNWLQAELKVLGRLLGGEPGKGPSAAEVARGLQHWLADPDFVAVREPKQLTQLPEAEGRSWRQLWAQVGDTLARARQRAGLKNKSDSP
jgi:serine/threonine protein kinase/WD40 repeat protein/Flp pilus assembly protein TadD